MSIRTSSKKVAFAALMVAPLILTACGSDSSDSEAAPTTTSTTQSSSATTSSSSTKSSTTGKSSTSETPTPVSEEPTSEQQGEEALAQELSENPVTFAEAAPVEAGQPASPEDAAAIENLVRGASEPTTLRGAYSYMVNNTCSRVIAASGEDAAQIDINTVPDTPLSGDGTGTVDSVSDVVVEGETASAWVVATAGGTTDSATQRFLREGGQWKFCD